MVILPTTQVRWCKAPLSSFSAACAVHITLKYHKHLCHLCETGVTCLSLYSSKYMQKNICLKQELFKIFLYVQYFKNGIWLSWGSSLSSHIGFTLRSRPALITTPNDGLRGGVEWGGPHFTLTLHTHPMRGPTISSVEATYSAVLPYTGSLHTYIHSHIVH